MKKVSENFNEYLRGIRQINAVVGYYDERGYFVLATQNDRKLTTEDEDILITQKGTIDYEKETINSVNVLFNASLFKTTCKSVQVECINKIPVGTTINVRIGVYKEDLDEYEYINYGDYIINQEPVYQADTKSYLITGFDKMMESMVDYDSQPLSINFPISHKDFVKAICNNFGWKYNLINYPGYNKMISEDIYTGQNLTCRDVLDDLNSACGGSFMFDINNNFIYKKPTETGRIIEDYDLKDVNVDFGEKYGKVNALTITSNENVVIDSVEDSESIELYGKTEININDSFILNAYSDRFIADLFNEINGLEYSLFDIDSTGLLMYDPLDIITFRHNGVDYKTIVFNDDIKLSQGLEETLFNEKMEEAQNEYYANDKEKAKLNNALISIDKANAQIVLKADSNGRIVQAELKSDADTGSEFNVSADNINLEGYTTINGGFSVDLKGNMTCNNATMNKTSMKDATIDGGSITLNDNGSSHSPTIRIDNLDTSGDLISFDNEYSSGNDLSGLYAKLNIPSSFRNPQNGNTGNIYHSSNGYIIRFEGELIGTASFTGGWYFRIILTNPDGSDTILYENEYDQMEQEEYVNIYLENFKLPNDFGRLTVKRNTSYNNFLYVYSQEIQDYVLINSYGLSVQDSYGSRYLNQQGIDISSNYGNDFREFSADIYNAPLLLFSRGNSQLLFDCMASNRKNDVFTIKINGTEYCKVNTSGITTTKLTQTSLEELKKNIELYNGALKEIEKTDIYKYNLKEEDDNSKKHLGIVIGENRNYSNEITSIVDGKEVGVDDYSMISLCLQGIKELNEILNNQQKEIDLLKKQLNDIITKED